MAKNKLFKTLRSIANKLPLNFDGISKVNHYRRIKKIYRSEGIAGVEKYILANDKEDKK